MEIKKQRPLIPLLTSYLTGLLLGNSLYLSPRLILILTAILLFIFLFSILRGWKSLSIIVSSLILILLGCFLINLYTNPRLPCNHIANLLRGDNLTVQGILYKPPQLLENRSRLYICAERVYIDKGYTGVTGKIMLTVGDKGTGLKYGDRVRFICKLRRPENFHNPGGFDYSRYLAFQRIFVTGYLKSSGEIARMGGGEGNPFRKGIEGLREEIRRVIDGKPELSNKDIIKALLLGEKREIPKEIREDFITAGAAHILAISGLHLGFIALVVFSLVRGTLKTSERLMLTLDINKAAAVITIFPVLFYALIAGFGISTFRATVMILTFLISIIIDRQRDLHNTLALAAFIITLISPTSIFDVSFQLSFISVLAIVYLFPKFLDYLSLPPDLATKRSRPVTAKVGIYIGFLALVSIAAIMGTGPIVAYHFNRIVLLGAISNLVVVPLVGFLIIPLSLSAAIMIFISGPIASLFLSLDSSLAGFVVDTTGLFARLPGVSSWVTTPTILEIVLFYLFIAFLFNMKGRNWPKYITLILLALLFSNYSYWHCVKNFNHSLRVTFLSIGQGDSALIELPGGKRMIIDGGGFYDDSFDTGRNILAPFLWKKKIRRIDHLVLSHPHPDHLNGLRFIARNFGVKEIWANGQGINMESYAELMKILEDEKIRERVMNNMTPPRYINGVKVDIYNPPVPLFRNQGNAYHSVLNNNSLVIKLTFRGISFLFTGDIEKEAEEVILKSGGNLESTVIKAPHHGSLTSSTRGFLAKVHPSYVVFSVGYKNRFGFPKKEIVERYREIGCNMFRTDRDGAVTMKTDGKSLEVKKTRAQDLARIWSFR